MTGEHLGRLAGRRVLVTRARAQVSRLCKLIELEGGRPIVLPTIEIRPPPSWSPVDAAIRSLSSYDWIVLTSVNGVSVWAERLQHSGVAPSDHPGVRYAVIGPATGRALGEWGRTPDLVPAEAVAEALLETLLAIGVRGKRVLLPQAAAARDVLELGLRKGGAIVDAVPLYETASAGAAGAEALAVLRSGRLDAVTFTSSSTVRYFAAIVDGASDLLRSTRVVCIGPVTADTARELGIRVDAVAVEHTLPGLMTALTSVLSAGGAKGERGDSDDAALRPELLASYQREEG